MKLTVNQKQFFIEALRSGLDVDFTYSGKHMYGRTCPAVFVDNFHELKTGAVVCVDNLGLGYVVYAMF